MASPVLLGAVCASGRAQVAVGFTEANQNLCGVVEKNSKPVRWSLKGTKLIAGGNAPGNPALKVPTLEGSNLSTKKNRSEVLICPGACV